MQAAKLLSNFQCCSGTLTRPLSCPAAQPTASCSYHAQHNQSWTRPRHSCGATFDTAHHCTSSRKTVITHPRKAKAVEAPLDNEAEPAAEADAAAAAPKKRGRKAPAAAADPVSLVDTAAGDQVPDESASVEVPAPQKRSRKPKAAAAVTDSDDEAAAPAAISEEAAASAAAKPASARRKKKGAAADPAEPAVGGVDLPVIPEDSEQAAAAEAQQATVSEPPPAEPEAAAPAKPRGRKASARSRAPEEAAPVAQPSKAEEPEAKQSEVEQAEEINSEDRNAPAKKTRVSKKQRLEEAARMEKEEQERQLAAQVAASELPAGSDEEADEAAEEGYEGEESQESQEYGADEQGEQEEEQEDEADVPRDFDVYGELSGGADSWSVHLRPNNAQEYDQMMFQMQTEQYMQRQFQAMEVEELAWQSHHMQNERGVNKYANVRRVAGLMTAFEADDYAIGPAAPGNISSWARSEIVFEEHFDEFNQYIADNMEEMVKRASQEEKQEELDIMDDVLLLPPLADEREEEKFPTQQEQDDMLMERYLDGILPGVSLNNLSDKYADDIFAEDQYDGDTDALEDPSAGDSDDALTTASDSDSSGSSDADV